MMQAHILGKINKYEHQVSRYKKRAAPYTVMYIEQPGGGS